jgi:regulator of sirC expression with transglutaminase-like and TPR domain
MSSPPDSEPEFCRPEAYRHFVAQLPILETTPGLLHAAIAIAMHAFEDADPAKIESQLQALAETVKSRAPDGDVDALVGHLHEVLFAEEGFAGDTDKFYIATNSYLPTVLKSKRGLPITLALIYKVVGEFAGLTVQGVNSPGRFFARVRCKQGWMLVDPYFCGQPLSDAEAHERMMNSLQRRFPFEDSYLQAATHAQWISRMLANLRSLFASEGRMHELKAMRELRVALRDATSTD